MKHSGSIDFEQDGAIAWLFINRPDKLNSVTAEMSESIHGHARRINSDSSVRVVIIRGRGDRSFSTGTDIKQLDAYKSTWEFRNRLDYCEAIRKIRKPVIAAVSGHALGGGFEICLCSDIRIAAETAVFGAPEIKLGWHAGESTLYLQRIVGTGQAMRLLLSGSSIDATEALRIGLVEQVVPLQELDKTAGKLASRISANAPIAVEVTKHLVRATGSVSHELGSAWQADLQGYCFSTADSKEGIAAFKEKRPPNFKGT